MRLTARATLLSVAISVAVLVVASVATLTLVDWNSFKGAIERGASARFGRTVTISGPLQAHLWSRTPTVTVVGLTVGGPPWEKDRAVAKIERVQIQLQLRSLFAGQLVLRRVELLHPELYLHQEKSGRANWTFENNAPSKARAAKPTKLPALRDLVIEGGRLLLVDDMRRLKVRGTLQAHDQASHSDPKPFRIEGKGTINGEPFEVHVAGGPLRALDPDHPYPFTLAINAGENEVNADGRILKPFDLGALELQVDTNGRDLAQLFYLTQVTLPNTPPYRLRAHVVRNGSHIAVTRIAGTFGRSDIAGTVEIDASHKRPDVRADLISQHLLLKDLAAVTGTQARANSSLTPVEAHAAPAPRVAQSSGSAAAPQLFPDARLQVDRMRAVDADVHFQATSIEAGTVPITHLSLHARLDGGTLAVEPLEFDLLQGRLTGTVQIDARSETPEVRAELRAKDIRLDEFRGKGPNAVPPLDGSLQGRAVITGTGTSVHQVLSDANGELTFIVPNGDMRAAIAELTGVDVAKAIGLMLAKPDDREPIRCGVAEFDVKTGTAHADSIVFDTQDVLITGKGQIALGPEKLDLTVQGEPKRVRLLRMRAPVDIRGELLKPTVRLETGHALKQGAIAATLGTLVTPLAAVLAFVDPGLAKDQNCAQLLAQARTSGRLALSSSAPTAPLPDERK
jgi:AsmA family protein